MSEYPNRNVLWAETFVDELARGGLEAVVVSPGSRSTPLTMAFASNDDVEVFSVLDERSAAYFALGRGRRTGEPTALVCTSGTAAANYHPAIVEASQGRVPLIALTADRPPELRDSGANQTVDQTKMYGDAVGWFRELPEPEATPRKLRRLRADATRALAEATGTPAGPVHVNCPFRKPLEPTPVDGDVPAAWAEGDERASSGAHAWEAARDDDHDQDGTGRSTSDSRRPYVSTTTGRPTLEDHEYDSFVATLVDADTGLIVAGPADPLDVAPTRETATEDATAPTGDESTADATAPAADESTDATDALGTGTGRPAFGESYATAIASLASTLAFPILADPLSDLRYGATVADAPVLGGYDGYVDALLDVVDPDVVVRFGASPTSKPLRKALADADARQLLVDPAGEWRDAEFATSDLVAADPTRLANALVDRLDATATATPTADAQTATSRAQELEATYWDAIDDARSGDDWTTAECSVIATALADAPDPGTVVVSNSMPIRDADRFGEPHTASLTVLGNRGASGIDGVTSTALGAGSATTDDLVYLTGDLAAYHDTNGLLSITRCDVDATIVVLNNDGGGIFHELPISDHDPPFTEQFQTPHGLDFEPARDFYDLAYDRVEPDAFTDAYQDALDAPGSHLIEVTFDAETSHDARERITTRCHNAVRDQVEELED
jgi:2-succinyl-5-enolpyruvyl-6-hydroxy-3-cyclohexene-1-carboxylate synthase